MDVVYAFVESMHFFIPIIAICVICGSIYFARGADHHEEYLHTAAEANERAAMASKKSKKNS